MKTTVEAYKQRVAVDYGEDVSWFREQIRVTVVRNKHIWCCWRTGWSPFMRAHSQAELWPNNLTIRWWYVQISH